MVAKLVREMSRGESLSISQYSVPNPIICPDPIYLTPELIGTDPSKLPPAPARLLAGDWKKGAIPEK